MTAKSNGGWLFLHLAVWPTCNRVVALIPTVS